ncbi:MAG: M12 family metallo-peptidase, partial [Bacteroidales bacterium]|nr:M12 family metallo-peptidase [Bacteroidales bacterium]
MRNFILVLLCLLTTTHVNYAQVNQLWNEPETVLKSTNGRWNGVHANQKALNRNALDAILTKINSAGTSQISIPHPLGGEMEFTVKPSNLLAKGLQDKYPEIKTFKGYNHKTGDHIRLNVNSNGMHAIVYSNNGNIYLDPQSDGSNNYVSYFQVDYKSANNFQKEFIEKHLEDEPHEGVLLKSANVQNKFRKRSLGTHLRKYRIAISTSSNYTSYHGGKTKALEAVVNTLDRITGVFEIDAAITFELVEGNDQLIFTSSNNPFSSITLSSKLREKNVEILNDIIGVENFDIEHLFTASGGGGEARAGQVCNAKGKGHGITQIRNPIGDAFDIEYVAHEIGHQLGALHSFGGVCSASLGSGSQFTQQSAYELGSGTSIMSYAG